MRRPHQKRLLVWRNILAAALRATLADMQFIKGWGLMVPALLFSIYAVLVWQFVGVGEVGGEIRDKMLAIATPLFAFPICYLVRLLFVIPDREIDLDVRIERMKLRLTPRFNIGAVRHEFAGRNSEVQNHLCLTVQNVSQVGSDICSAQFVELATDTGKTLVDPVELQWLGTHGDQHWGQIPSSGTRTVKAFQVAGDELQFNPSATPATYQNFLSGAKMLKGKIAFDDRYWGGQYVHFVAYAGDDPRIEILQIEAFAVPNAWDTEDGQCQ